jgi:hypothetical protein
MLTQQEKDFIRYWAANRLRRKKVVTQFLIGIPIGLAFVIPIVINLVSGWYKRAQMEANSQDFNPAVLLVALLLIVAFTAIFYQRHQWDQYEQRYRELLAREARENTSTPTPNGASAPGIAPSPDDALTSRPGSPTPAPNGSGDSDAPPNQDMEQKTGKN